MGIRIFNSKEQLQEIFESFEPESDDEDESGDDAETSNTAVVTSQLRHFVVQVRTLLSSILLYSLIRIHRSRNTYALPFCLIPTRSLSVATARKHLYLATRYICFESVLRLLISACTVPPPRILRCIRCNQSLCLHPHPGPLRTRPVR